MSSNCRSKLRTEALIVFSLLGATLSVATAALSWESLTGRGEYISGKAEIAVNFPFRNNGKEDVEIVSIRPACGCTATKLAKTTFKPGERGVLVVVFTVGNRTGLQRKVIAVQEKGLTVPTILTLEVSLPESLHLSVAELDWKVGVEAAEQKVTVSAESDIKIDEVTTTNPVFKFGIDKASESRSTITVRPEVINAPLTALLRIKFSGKQAGSVAVALRIR